MNSVNQQQALLQQAKFTLNASLFFFLIYCQSLIKTEENVAKLHRATLSNNMQAIKNLLNKNVSVNSIHRGSTPIFIATYLGDIKLTSFLVSKGAVIDIVSYDGFDTPLMSAVSHGREGVRPLFYDENIVKYLLDNGAKKTINYEDAYGATALMYACKHGSPMVVKWLLEAGADPTIVHKATWYQDELSVFTFLDSILDHIHPPGSKEEIRKLLMQYGAKE